MGSDAVYFGRLVPTYCRTCCLPFLTQRCTKQVPTQSCYIFGKIHCLELIPHNHCVTGSNTMAIKYQAPQICKLSCLTIGPSTSQEGLLSNELVTIRALNSY